MIRSFITLVTFSLFLSSCSGFQESGNLSVDLNGRWEFRATDDSVWHEATVPGTIHTDLYKNVLIDDPFYRNNEKNLQWIDKKDWDYKRTFIPDPRIFNKQHIVLKFNGIDSYAEVFLNGCSVISADNMFRTWQTDISGILIKGEKNELLVKFKSPINHLRNIYDQAAFNLPAVNDQADEKVSVYGRKAPFHFGWDWGPRFVTSGIWKSVTLEAWDEVKIVNVHYQQLSLNNDLAHIQINATIYSDKEQTANLEISTIGDQGLIVDCEIELHAGENQIVEDFEIPDPERWWSNGLGEPRLYTLKAEVKSKHNSSYYSCRFGLREIELVREPDSFGESFYFKVNGIPVFMKGANYIPQDNFQNHVMSTEYDHIIRSVKSANMNMLRVWGGGIYELDYFYDLCDENGILVWQDFMFACSMYPADTAFTNSFAQEAKDNIKRLRNHACLAIWCGNNEVQDAWHQWGWQFRYTDEQKSQIADDYQKIFHEIIPEILNQLDPDRPYWPSSPASGTKYGQTSKTTSGDMHYWGVWHGRRPFESYAEVIPRFSSEYGFQSFPAIKTIESYTLPADRHIDSDVMLSHQRHPIGNELILNYMERYYPVPEDFEGFVYMSQVMQGEGIRYGIEALRRSMPRCMGSLYWQLNDCWPVASWSGIDYFGRWKALHYQAKNAYSPTLISISETSDSIQFSLVSDLIESKKGILEIELINFEGGRLFKTSMPATFKPLTSYIVQAFPKSKFSNNTIKDDNVVIVARFISDNSESLTATHYLARSKDLNLPDVDIQWELIKTDLRDKLIITSEKLARQVYVRYAGDEELRFEPNFFDLLPGEQRILNIYKRTKDSIDPEEIRILSINHFSKPKNKSI